MILFRKKRLKVCAVILSGLFVSPAFAETEIPTARASQFHAIQIDKIQSANGKTEIEIYGSVTYGNKCMVSDQKVKKVSLLDRQLRYQIYSGKDEGKLCPKVYIPVTKTYLIDRVLVSDGLISAIFVNDQQVY